MATSELGMTVPAGTDAFDPQGDMVAMANSFKSRVVVPVANTTARAALVAAISWAPSASEPLHVWRADATTGQQHEITTNGTTWRVLVDLAQVAWQSYTPSIAATGGGLSLGTGSVVDGAYCRIGNLVSANVQIKFGTSGAAFGSGTFIISLPASSVLSSTDHTIGSAWIYDASTSTSYMAAVVPSGVGNVQLRPHGTTGPASGTVPMTWAATDALRFEVTYEAT